MADDFNLLATGRQSPFWQMEDYFNFVLSTAQTQLVIDFLDELGLYKQYIQFSSSPPPISRKNNYIIASIPITF